jgi:hypothetical protein
MDTTLANTSLAGFCHSNKYVKMGKGFEQIIKVAASKSHCSTANEPRNLSFLVRNGTTESLSVTT